MVRLVVGCLVAIAWGANSPFVLGQERALGERALEQAAALDKVIQDVVAASEPAIACILVSRNNVYRRLPGQAAELTGKLGDFDLQPFLYEDKSTEERERLRRKYDLADPAYVPEAFGSGVVVDAQGLILTNYHVIRDATKIYVHMPGDKAGYADIHAADPRSDLAVLRLRVRNDDAKLLPLKPIVLGNASSSVRGQSVLILSNPFAAGFRDGQPMPPRASSAMFAAASPASRARMSGPSRSITTAPCCRPTRVSTSVAAAAPC